ncbi:hypothetical protein KCU81_g4045, partial [Aureobasidium melanogenum]|uniref:Uncharacterized protein n=1 Tax=Aureobasidium melanogenum (strain CBS 110374) TaxID=1043003 RepID=A0A074VMF6_AURM1
MLFEFLISNRNTLRLDIDFNSWEVLGNVGQSRGILVVQIGRLYLATIHCHTKFKQLELFVEEQSDLEENMKRHTASHEVVTQSEFFEVEQVLAMKQGEQHPVIQSVDKYKGEIRLLRVDLFKEQPAHATQAD